MALGPWYGRALSVAGALAALVPALVMWGFTVDDALIPLRYAHHLAAGEGYRFSAQGAATDGVTPLPWALVLAPLASSDLVVALERAKALGVVTWTVAGALLGRALAKRTAASARGALLAVVGLFVVALAFPIGAWAASGMETGIATALATTAAVSFARPRAAAAFAGLAACFRPELVVWALVLAVGASLATVDARASLASADASATRAVTGHVALGDARVQSSLVRDAAVCAALAVFPFATCALVRLVVFGRPAPLALMAKPSDVAHGFAYAGAALIVALTPLLACAPLALWRASALGKTLVLALASHLAVVVLVGGDWMPYARLMVPVAPSLALAFVELGHVAHVASSAARALASVAVGALVASSAAPRGRHVHADRKALIERARPVLGPSRIVAALDIGWVGAATRAEVVDLAGLTDPAIAALPGGHTSKAVDVAMLLDRGVDTIVVYDAPRRVEQRLLGAALLDERFVAVASLPLGAGPGYTVYRRR